jgi:hypothetical protein
MQHRGASTIARQRSGADAPNASAVMEVRNITTTKKYYEPLGESCGCFYHVVSLTLIHSSLTSTHTPLSLA